MLCAAANTLREGDEMVHVIAYLEVVDGGLDCLVKLSRVSFYLDVEQGIALYN